MRSVLLFALAVSLLLGSVQGLEGQEDARAVIEKAVKAHGGAERLSQIKAAQVETKGTIFVGGAETSFTGKTFIQLPRQFRNEMNLIIDGKPRTMVQILNGDQGWISLDGKTTAPPNPLMNEMKEMMHMEEVVRLTPLLKEKGYELIWLGESKVGDKAVLGVKVKTKGFRDVSIYIDKATGLIRKTEHVVLDDNGKEVTQQEFYDAYKDVQGVQRPMKVEVLREGKRIMTGELTDAKYLDRIDDSQFAKPK